MGRGKKRRAKNRRAEEEEALDKQQVAQPFFAGSEGSRMFFHVGTVQQKKAPGVQASPETTVSRQVLKDKLRNLLMVVWLNQSGGKKTIQLTPELSGALTMASTLSEADLLLLWRPVPKNPGEVLKLISNSLPEATDKSTIKKLEALRLNLVIGGGMKPAVPEPKTPAKSSEQKSELAKRLQGDEELFKQLVNALKQQKPEEKDKNTEIIKKVLEAYLETGQGKKVKEKALEYLLSKKGLPFLLIVGSGALAGMIANNTDIPSTPEIPLSDNLSLKAEFKGTFQKPESVTLSLKFTFGGSKRAGEGERKAPALMPLSAEVLAFINRIDRRLLAKWMVHQAHEEYDKAGPDEEDKKRSFYLHVRDNPDELPDTRLFAQHVAREMLKTATKNRINQLKGQPLTAKIDIRMGHDVQWNQFYSLPGLYPILSHIASGLAPIVPFNGLGIKQVAFYAGRKIIPVRLLRKE